MEELDAAVEKQMAFIEQLLGEKPELTKRTEERTQELEQAKRRAASVMLRRRESSCLVRA